MEMMSQDISKLTEALAKAQGSIEDAEKSKKNEYFKSSYSNLSDVWKVCREPLSQNGLAVVQTIESTAENPCLITMLSHASGQWIRSVTPLLLKGKDSQSLGSAITYNRRYALAAMVGVCPDENSEDRDDDGNAASGKGSYKDIKTTIAGKKEPENYIPEKSADATPEVEKISKDQIRILQTMMAGKIQMQNKFKERADVKTLADLPVARFEGAIEWIEDQIAKGA